MATPKWNKERKMWILQAKKNGIRKTFYSSVSGQKGKKEVLAKYDDWMDFGGIENITVAKCLELYLRDIESRLGRKTSYIRTESYSRLYILPTLSKAKMTSAFFFSKIHSLSSCSVAVTSSIIFSYDASSFIK